MYFGFNLYLKYYVKSWPSSFLFNVLLNYGNVTETSKKASRRNQEEYICKDRNIFVYKDRNIFVYNKDRNIFVRIEIYL